MEKQAKATLLLSVSVITLGFASSAFAQETRVSAVPSTAPGQLENASDKSDQVADIVVTAQRRRQPLQQVPVAVSVISSQDLQASSATGSMDLTAVVPGLEYNPQGANGASPFIRGVGTQTVSAGYESPSALIVDGVYYGIPASTLFSLNNISQIAVLKGPQGTLFGRNATSGVVQVTTRDPSRQAEGEISVGYSNYDTFTATAYASTPLSDTLAVNLAVGGSHQGTGWGKDIVTGQDVHLGADIAGRFKALWTPDAETSLLLSADATRSTYDYGLNSENYPGSVTVSGGTFAGRFNNMAFPRDTRSFSQYGVSLALDHSFGRAKIVSISAYRSSLLYYLLDQDGGPVFNTKNSTRNPITTFSQEVHILSDGPQRLTWLVGLFYFQENALADPNEVSGSAVAPLQAYDTVSAQHLKSWSGFADGTFKITPSLGITLGGRYTRDTYDFSSRRVSSDGAPLISVDDGRVFSKFTYRAVLDYQITPDVLAYASRSRGFHSGGFSLSNPTAAPVKPEVLDSTEVGLKTEWFNKRLRANFSAFHYDYRNLQVAIVIVGAISNINAGAARIDGYDVDLEAVPVRGLTITAGFSGLDSKYTSFTNGPLYLRRPATCTPTPTLLPGPATGGNLQCASDLAGNQLVQAPKFTANTSATYQFNSDVGKWEIGASFYHNSGFDWEADNTLSQPSYNLVNGHVTWGPAKNSFRLTVWGKNIFNRYYDSYAVHTGQRVQEIPASPRTFGATASVSF